MADEQIVVSDDWTKNWQAKIAVKTTAIFLWMVIAVSFVGLIWLNRGMESEVTREIERDIQGAAFQINQLLLTRSLSRSDGENLEAIAASVGTLLLDSHLEALQLEMGGASLVVGHAGAGMEQRRITVEHARTGDGGLFHPLRITAYHTPINELVRARRDGILVVTALSILFIGIVLSWTIQNVLARPFEVLVDATQQISKGNLDVRLDVSREDEFGKLSRFFNEMLDTIALQQDALSRTNQELTVEIGERKRAEQELKSHRDQLELQVAERTRDLQDARDQALEASRTKSAFIANISHEIRTPLTPIIGFSETLLDGQQTPDARRHYLKSIIRNSRHLLTLINDILDLSKIEANRLEIEKLSVNLFELLQDVDSLVGMQAREKGLEFETRHEFPLPDHVITDPLRLKQILMNLASNAVKFTDKGFVRISAAFDSEADRVLITVVDTGIGVNGEKRERLFQAFSQADSSTTREYGGTGLGLYISQRLARLLGGDIEMESVLGVGSRFVLRIDAGTHGAARLLYERPQELEVLDTDADTLRPGSLRGKVLLAEDNPDNQQLFSLYLRQLGAEVTVCENGRLAMEEAQKRDFDLILMDMQMPVMSGMEAVETLRAMGYRDPVYALTANAMKEDIQRYLQAGCDGFLAKPVEKSAFNSVMKKHLKATKGESLESTEDEQYQELVQRFVTGLPEHARVLETDIEHGNWEKVAGLAHQLKGMGGAFGYPRITQAADELERHLRRDDHEAARETAHRLVEMLRPLSERQING